MSNETLIKWCERSSQPDYYDMWAVYDCFDRLHEKGLYMLDNEYATAERQLREENV